MTEAPTVAGERTVTASPDSLSSAPGTRSAWQSWVRSQKANLLAPVAYLLLASLAYLPVWEHWHSQLNGCNCWDQIMEQWLISWPTAAFQHGHSLLTSTYLNAPGGVNLMWNTSMPALGVLASPMVALIGPIHTFTILLTLGFASSSWTMFLLLRRWVASAAAAWIGGLVYGFSSFAAAEGIAGRLNLIWWPLPPLLVICLDRVLCHRQPAAKRTGLVVGVLLTLQLLVNEEALPIMAILAVVALVLALARQDGRRLLINRWAELSRAGATALATFLVLSSYPLYTEFRGPYRLSGPVQSLHQLAAFRADLASPVIPSFVQKFHPSWADSISHTFSNNPTEVTEYLGLPLLIFLLIGTVLLCRRARVQMFVGVAIVSFMLSLGPKLIIATHVTPVPGPYDVLAHLPLVNDIMPSRFALGLWFGVAVLLATFVETLDGAVRQWSWTRSDAQRFTAFIPVSRAGTARPGGATALLAPAIALLCVLPLVPNWPYLEKPASIPTFFTSSAVNMIPEGALAATYPYPVTSISQPMDWQAVTGMRFRILGGYVIGPAADGSGTYFAYPNSLEYCFVGVYVDGVAFPNTCNAELISSTLKRLGVTTIFVGQTQPHADLAKTVVSSAVGAEPRYVDGVLVWSCVPVGRADECSW